MTLIIPFTEGERHLNWLALTDALVAGHQRPKAQLKDVFLYEGADTLLNRSAWIKGLGMAVKAATIFPGNKARGKATVGGAVSLFSDEDGTLEAVIDFQLVTKWKTAGDSLLAAKRLARPDSNNILIVGAGTVGASLYEAYKAEFPNASFSLWNRSRAAAQDFAKRHPDVKAADNLEQAVSSADIVTCATMTREPIIRGDWLRPGQHIDLIGAFRPDMREADDKALQHARIFVDSRDTTLDHIGELKIPLQAGVIAQESVIADFYQPDLFARQSTDDITLFKNGGGAHLDLMTSRYIMNCWKDQT